MSLDMNQIVGTHDIVMITLDTLRYDVARDAFDAGETPLLAELIGSAGWELRHTPGSFTYAAHQAFFAGFLPTPSTPGPHPRLFAAAFPGSETTDEKTQTFETATIVEGLAQLGYTTLCAGGVGFFNKMTALGSVFPSLFDESHWERAFGVTDPASTEHQIAWANERLEPCGELTFLFVNVSAIHQPNNLYLDRERPDDVHSHRAALAYVDKALASLVQTYRRRARPSFWIVCSDHGTAYGEDGFEGHRLAHPTVWNVPYAHCVLEGQR